MATFSVFFSPCQRIKAKHTEFSDSRSRKHLFVPLWNFIILPKRASAPKILRTTGLDDFIWFVLPFLHLINLYIYFVGLFASCFGGYRSCRDCAAWMIVCVCECGADHFTPQCWNTSLFTPAGQRLQCMPSTKNKHTYPHPLCPLIFNTYSLHTLPSNAACRVKSL